MNNNRKQIYFVLGVSLLLVFITNSLYFTMPYEHLNPYEYFQGEELTHFQILNILTGGIALPLMAIITGSLIRNFREAGLKTIILTLVMILIIGIIQSVLIFGYDILPSLAIAAIIGSLFLRVNKWVTVASFVVLMFLHVFTNGFGEILFSGNGLQDTIYTNIQEMNEYSSIFRSTDYFAIVGMNLEIFWEFTILNIYENILSILPFILLGMTLFQFNIIAYIKENITMLTFLIIVILGGGFTIKILQVVSLGSSSIFTIAEVIGGSLLSIGIFLILLMLSLYLPGVVLNVFESMGEKGLTAYVVFNIGIMLLSYGFGFQLYGEISIAAMVSIVIVSYIILVLVSMVLKRLNIKTLEHVAVIDKRK